MVKTDISVDNSYVFTNPLKAQSDGKDKIRITIFILNGQGLGVLGKNVTMNTNENLKFDVIQQSTDSTGKVLFDVSSTVPGEYYLDVSIDQVKLPQKARLTFYQ